MHLIRSSSFVALVDIAGQPLITVGRKKLARRRHVYRGLEATLLVLLSFSTTSLSAGASNNNRSNNSATAATTTTAGAIVSGNAVLFPPSTGLINHGNTCYLNAQLECAYHIPHLRNLILSSSSCPQSLDLEEGGMPHHNSNNNNPGLAALSRVFADMESTSIPNIKGRQGMAVAPTPTSILCRALGINVMEQQDSQEFWKLLLPELGFTPLTDLYLGAFENYIAALDGTGRERKNEEPFLDLSLDVTSGSVLASLEEMFNKPELLSEQEGNGWRPEKGADKVDALKGSLLKVQGLPSLLQLHLKRFQYNWQTDSMSKINRRFQFPKVLDLSTICTNIQKDEVSEAVYDLQSILVHVGEYGGGHYYAYVRPDLRKNIWYRFDDERVTQVDFSDVLADSFGGRRRRSNPTATTEQQRGGALRAFFKFFMTHDGEYGWGGPKSSAYMIQYVRRSDVPKLFGTTPRRKRQQPTPVVTEE